MLRLQFFILTLRRVRCWRIRQGIHLGDLALSLEIMNFLFPIFVVLALVGVALRVWYRRRRRIAANSRVGVPKSHYSTTGVKDQVDGERCGASDAPRFHPLNQEEVARLLEVVDV